MLSIIVAIHNQLPMNRLFWDYLCKNTDGDWELIIIDNSSVDGSREFFESVGAVVIKNTGNYPYPYCQNKGMAVAKGDLLAFLNNDVIVPKGWNTRLQASMIHNNLDLLTSCGIERVESKLMTRRLRRRWRWIKGLTIFFLGKTENSLKWMHRLMYPNWNEFSENRLKHFRYKTLEGFVGNTVMMTRRAVDLIGLWDERIQAADFDLYLRSKKRAQLYGDMKPMHVALDVFVHHYIRLTMGDGYPPFVDQNQLISLEDKWSEQDLQSLKTINDDLA
jgi:GT2 family glycosyltransferase